MQTRWVVLTSVGLKIKLADGSFRTTAGIKAKSLHFLIDGVACRAADRWNATASDPTDDDFASMPKCKLCLSKLSKLSSLDPVRYIVPSGLSGPF